MNKITNKQFLIVSILSLVIVSVLFALALVSRKTLLIAYGIGAIAVLIIVLLKLGEYIVDFVVGIKTKFQPDKKQTEVNQDGTKTANSGNSALPEQR